MTPPSSERYPLLAPEALADPYPLYRRMREEAPIYWSGQLQSWVLTRYRDVVATLRDTQTFSSRIAFGRSVSEEQRALAPTRHWFGQGRFGGALTLREHLFTRSRGGLEGR